LWPMPGTLPEPDPGWTARRLRRGRLMAWVQLQLTAMARGTPSLRRSPLGGTDGGIGTGLRPLALPPRRRPMKRRLVSGVWRQRSLRRWRRPRSEGPHTLWLQGAMASLGRPYFKELGPGL